MSGNVRLDARHHRAIGALLTGQSIVEAARTCGVAERTLRCWLQREDFQKALREAEGAVLRDAMRKLGSLMDTALETVGHVLRDDNANESVRIRAAGFVLGHALKWREQLDLEERIAALERSTDKCR